jgi:hypothetical protein
MAMLSSPSAMDDFSIRMLVPVTSMPSVLGVLLGVWIVIPFTVTFVLM